MRAARIKTYGAPPEVENVDSPVLEDGQELVQNVVAGLNPVDLAIASGTFDAGQPPVPYSAGLEGIGRLGSGEMVWYDGAIPPSGSLAEQTVITTGSGIALPDGIDPEQAIAFGIAGMAAWLSLDWRGGLEEGETVLVLGAGGSVGQIAVQAARLMGAGRVAGAARSDSGRDRAAEAGADAVVDTSEPDLTAALLDATEGGPDLVIDCLWGSPAAAAIGAIKPSGRMVQVGNSAGKVSEIGAGRLRGFLIDIRGFRNFWAPKEVQAEAFLEMCRHSIAGDLQIEVEVVPLEQAADVWQRQADSPGHKLAIQP